MLQQHTAPNKKSLGTVICKTMNSIKKPWIRYIIEEASRYIWSFKM